MRLSPAIVTFMRAEPDVYPWAWAICRLFPSDGFFTHNLTEYWGYSQGSGDTMTPMRYNLFSNLLNVFGNYVLILVSLDSLPWAWQEQRYPLHCARGCCFSCPSCHIQQEPQHWCVVERRLPHWQESLRAFNQYWVTLSHGAVFAQAGAGVFLPCRSRVGNGYLCGTPNSNQYLFFDFYTRPGFWYGSYHHGGPEFGCQAPRLWQRRRA